ncbi:PilZ domain-containing protein [Sphingosinicella rhizophila]|uniref:PilZ domain-containing protein n=1 Tax=Sphingosinicella rhizophila TaxID=3050082 RepID=A0ABU3Q1Y2_9SPHN|nr:PilZ domain-containing protein [Sphingosinicella sp. GR2756]MDT9597426.1 PilZ domain-containing protein [Sphingosinicella sp. GR2756]
MASLRAGALISGSIREICFIRKISGGGALLHVDSPVAVGQRLELELMAGQQLAGTISWRRGSEVAIQFDTPVDVFAIIASDLVSQPGERRRMPRVELCSPARVETEQGQDVAITRDVSQGGVKIECQNGLVIDQRVAVTLEDFRPLEGHVRWASGIMAGIEFEQELAWQDLMPWLKDRRNAALRARPAPVRSLPSDGLLPVVPSFSGSVDLNLPARIREGTNRWNIDVAAITTRHVEFESFASPRIGTLLWLVLPGLEGWPARVTEVEQCHFTCEFTQPLHPAVLERILVDARRGRH